jgi:hypothetical protein
VSAVLAGTAPAAAIAAGLFSSLTEFREWQELILVMMVAGAAAGAVGLAGDRDGRRLALTALALGPAMWAGAQVVYVAVQLVQGDPFEADRFGPQWVQAVGLIAAHAVFLGVPTGLAAALLVLGWRRWAPGGA